MTTTRHHSLRPVAIAIDKATQFLAHYDAQDPPPAGAQLALGLNRGHTLVAAAILGHPVPPARDDGLTVEITRAGTREETTPTLVALYQQAWRCARLLGYQYLITHTPVFAREITYGLHHVGLCPAASLPPRAGSHTPPRLRLGRGVDGVCRIRWAPHRQVTAAVHHPSKPATRPARPRQANAPAYRSEPGLVPIAVLGRCA